MYMRKTRKTADVTVEYVDTDGNEIHAPQIITGNVGDDYDATTDGYKLNDQWLCNIDTVETVKQRIALE